LGGFEEKKLKGGKGRTTSVPFGGGGLVGEEGQTGVRRGRSTVVRIK